MRIALVHAHIWRFTQRLHLRTDLAKTSSHVLSPERFAVHIGTHLVSKYEHLHKAFVTVEKLRWARIPIVNEFEPVKLHPHSYFRDGDDKRFTSVEAPIAFPHPHGVSC